MRIALGFQVCSTAQAIFLQAEDVSKKYVGADKWDQFSANTSSSVSQETYPSSNKSSAVVAAQPVSREMCPSEISSVPFDVSSQIDSGPFEGFPKVFKVVEHYLFHTQKWIVGMNDSGELVIKVNGLKPFEYQLVYDNDHYEYTHTLCRSTPYQRVVTWHAKVSSNVFVDGGTPPEKLIWIASDKTMFPDPVAWSKISLGDGCNELFTACRSGDSGVVKCLFENDDSLDVNMTMNGTGISGRQYLEKRHGAGASAGYTPLHLACNHGHALVVQELLRIPSIQVNKVDLCGWSSLQVASGKGHSEIVRLLLDHPKIDVNLNPKAVVGAPAPLHLACVHNRLGVVQQLIAHADIDINIQRNFTVGRTPLMYAIDSYSLGDASIVKCLLAHPKIDTTLVDKNGRTALTMASKNNYTGILQLLQNPEEYVHGGSEINQTIHELRRIRLSPIYSKIYD